MAILVLHTGRTVAVHVGRTVAAKESYRADGSLVGGDRPLRSNAGKGWW